MYLKELFRMNKELELRTEPRDLHFPPLECKDKQTIDKVGQNS